MGTLAATVVLVGAAGAASGSTHRGRPAHGPFDRSYVIAALATPTGHSPIRTLSEVEVWFGRDRQRSGRLVRGMGWNAHCNTIGGRFRFHAHRLVPFELSETLLGCESAAEREDRWLGRFFDARPRWAIHHGHLTLRAPLGTMTLRPGAALPGPP